MAKSQSVIARNELEGKVEERTAELQCIIEELRAENGEHKRAEDTNRRLAWIVESTDDAVLSRTPEGIITSWNAEEQLLLTKYAVDHFSDSAVIVASDARIVFANDVICNALGYTHEELLKLTVHDIDPSFPKGSGLITGAIFELNSSYP
jgi:PAS domain-containing protein